MSFQFWIQDENMYTFFKITFFASFSFTAIYVLGNLFIDCTRSSLFQV